MIFASAKLFLAFNNSNFNPLFFSNKANSSESSTEPVPIKIGCPLACNCSTVETTCAHFAAFVSKI
ncbi:hypothetical protein IJR75_01850 [bacterium]|nr:hypothetical protein [bacterium]